MREEKRRPTFFTLMGSLDSHSLEDPVDEDTTGAEGKGWVPSFISEQFARLIIFLFFRLCPTTIIW